MRIPKIKAALIETFIEMIKSVAPTNNKIQSCRDSWVFSAIPINKLVVFSILAGFSFSSHADLNFTFNAADESSRPGDGIQVEWVVTNDGTVQENNISVEVPFPTTGINSLGESLTDGGDCSFNCDPGETIVWSLGNIAPGESRVASFPFRVSTSAANGSIDIEARLLQGTSVLATSGWTHQVQASLVAELSIDSSKALVAPGEIFSFGFLAGNRGSDALSSATLTVPVPSQFAVVSASGGSVSGNTVTWNLGNLPAGRVTRRVINARVRSNVEMGELLVLDNATLSGTIFGLAQTAVADHVVSVGDSALDFHIRSQETQFRPGESQNIEIVVSNTSNQTIQGVTVSFLYPFNLSSVGTSDLLGAVCSFNCDPGERASWNLGNLLPGETRQLRFRTAAPSNAQAGVPVRWQGRLSVGSDLVSREYLAIGNSVVDVNLQIDTDDTQVASGDVYHYTFNVGNTGIDSIASALLTVPVPDGVTVLESFDGTLSSGVVSWSLNNLGSGAVIQRTLRVRADNNLANGSIVNLIDAEVSANVFGLPQASMAQHLVSIGEVPLDLEVRLQQGVAQQNESVLVELVVSNNGSQVQQNVFAGLLFPDDIASASTSNLEAASCSFNCDSGEQMFVSFGNLVPGETKSVAHSVTVASGAFSGEHTSWVGNVFSDNNLSRRVEATLGISQVGLEVQAVAEQLLVASGDNIAYQFASGNTAGFLAGNAQLIVPLPSGVSVINSPGGQIVDDRVIYSLGDIEDEEIILRELTLAVAGGTPAGTQIVLENIELSAEFFGVEQATYGGHVVAVGSSPLTGEITVEPIDPQPGESVEVTINILNDSLQVQQNVAARLRYPAGVNSIAESFADGGDCSFNCDSGEDIVWSLGTLVPGDTATISFITSISNGEPEGGMIEWPARIQAGTTNQRRIEAASLIGNVTQGPSTAGALCNGLPVTVNLNLGQTPGPGSDVILGTPGVDIIVALGGDDTICGEGGNDVINAGSGDDWVDAGAGDDRVFGLAGADIISGGLGADEIVSGSGEDLINGGEGNDVLNGGPDDDIVSGGAGSDSIFGQGGDDLLNGEAGNDFIIGANGEDQINGGAGNDILNGGPGNDVVNGDNGADTVFGLSGNDTLDGGLGDDQVFGQLGSDTITGGGGNDDLFGNEGDDVITAVSGNNTINGGPDSDTITGGSGDDNIFGDGNLQQAGNDIIDGGGGSDLLVGFAGSDTITSDDGIADIVNGGPGADLCTTDSFDTVFNCP